ncbi:ParB/RepB/Spo0J family partition protein, partial [Candidatus Margulisiibacteriota bacterium]
LALIENLQREDLNAMDEAEGYSKLAEEFKLTQEAIAKKVGKNRSTVTNLMRLLNLPKVIKDSLRKEQITVGHARALLAISDDKKQLATWQQIIKSRLNVRDAEVLAGAKPEKAKKGGRKRAFTQNVELNALVEKLTTHLGTKVKIFGTPNRGRIEINYYSREDLDRVLEIIGGRKKKEIYIATTENLAASQS